jgi:hypothetical protein
MTLIRRFRSDADVERYFVLLRELTPSVETPPDLWELIESSRRVVQQKVSMPRCLAPAPHSVELQVFASAKRRNIQPAKALDRIIPLCPVRGTRLKASRIRPTPMSWKELLQSKREGK